MFRLFLARISMLGVLVGTLCYLITGDPVWAGVAAAAVKILVPDNSTGGDQVFDVIAKLAQVASRPLLPAAQAPERFPATADPKDLVIRHAGRIESLPIRDAAPR